MAKRFTDTVKWNKESFMNLSVHSKLLWLYLCDHCDHAGIWEKNLKLASCHLGFSVTEKHLNALSDKLTPIDGQKLWIRSFVEFQYGTLVDNNNAHKAVISRLKKYGIDPWNLGADKPPNSPKSGAQEKEKDMDKEKDMEMDKEKESSKGELMRFAIGVFCREYKRRYGTKYEPTGKEKGILGTMVSDLGKNRFEILCEAYLDMADSWFITRRHDVVTFNSNVAKVSQFEQSGRLITNTEIRMIDQRQANSNVFDKVIAEAEERERQNGKQ